MRKNVLMTAALLIAGVVSFMSCCEHEIVCPNQNPINPEGTAIQFSSNIVKMDSPTRATGNVWEKDDAIGVYMIAKESVTVVNEMSNVKYETKTGGLSGDFVAASKVIYFPDNGTEVRFMSYYPYTTADLVDDVYKVNVSDQTSQAKIDLLYSFHAAASYEKTASENVIPLKFDHQLTNVLINIKSGIGLAAGDLEDIAVHFSGVNTTADFDLMTGLLSNLGDVDDVSPNVTITAPDYTISYESIILPMPTVPENAKIVFSMANGDVFEWEFNKALDASTQYIYNVTINRTGIEVEATINNWIDGGEDEVDAV